MFKSILALTSVLIVLLFSSTASANYTHKRVTFGTQDGGTRANSWESTFVLSYGQSADTKGDNATTLEVDSQVGWGFTLGYNLNNHFLINYELNYSRPSYTAQWIDDGIIPKPHKVRHTMDLISNQFSAVYNFSQERFTPYIQAGLGWTYMDSNVVQQGPGGTVCWWDPWWGYICSSSTYSDSKFSYNGAVGVRYDFSNRLVLKANYSMLVSDMRATDDLNLGIFKLEIGSTF